MMSRPFCLFHTLRCLPQSELKQPTAGAHISLVVPLHPDPHALWCEGSVRATGESSPVEITMDVLKELGRKNIEVALFTILRIHHVQQLNKNGTVTKLDPKNV